MSRTTAVVGALAAGLVVLSSAPASAQPSSEIPSGYLGSAGERLPGSVTGSLPGYATGPLGSVATAACNAGSVAGLAGVAVPAEVDPVCQFAPALGESIDHFMSGDYHGSVEAVIGGVPYVGSILTRVVPTDSAADAIENAAGQGSEGAPGALPLDSISSELPGS